MASFFNEPSSKMHEKNTGEVFQPSCAFAAYRARRAALKFSRIRHHRSGGVPSVKPSGIGSGESGVQESDRLFLIVRYYFFIRYIFTGSFWLPH
jgi:hypothetical protein